jgi:glycosyltransferase involved in cell wall biosynthesis
LFHYGYGDDVPSLSLIVITKNEEASIARCLSSLDFADDIVVVDSGSTDRTVELARAHGAHVVSTTDWPGFGPQKSRALNLARGDWVFSLDADEWIDASFIAQIKTAIADPNAPSAYETPRRSRFCGQIIRHGGWSPDYVVRLFQRGRARFSDDLVHEGLIVDGPIRRLKVRIEHDCITSWADAEDKIKSYSVTAAQQLAARGFRGSPLKASLHGWTAFLKAYVYRAGFLDGAAGWGVAEYNRRYADAKWRRLAEYSQGNVWPGLPWNLREWSDKSSPPTTDTVPLDWVRALSSWKYAKLTASIYWRRSRTKLPRHFRCDCGARHTWNLSEHQHWDKIQTVTCHDCGDIYRTLQNTVVRIIPNPLHRCLISDRDRNGIADGHPFSVQVREDVQQDGVA